MSLLFRLYTFNEKKMQVNNDIFCLFDQIYLIVTEERRKEMRDFTFRKRREEIFFNFPFRIKKMNIFQ